MRERARARHPSGSRSYPSASPFTRLSSLIITGVDARRSRSIVRSVLSTLSWSLCSSRRIRDSRIGSVSGCTPVSGARTWFARPRCWSDASHCDREEMSLPRGRFRETTPLLSSKFRDLWRIVAFRVVTRHSPHYDVNAFIMHVTRRRRSVVDFVRRNKVVQWVIAREREMGDRERFLVI